MIKLGDSFKAQVATMVSGTAVAQVISLALMPILTRLYTPADFGVIAVVMAVGSLWSLVATMRLENAILLPKDDGEADELLGLAMISNALGAMILYAGLTLFTSLSSGHFTMLADVFAQFAAPIAFNSFLIGFMNLLNQWHNRHARFVVTSRRVVVERASFIALSLLLYHQGAVGLIAAQLFSASVVAVYLLYSALGPLDWRALIPRKRHVEVFKAYYKFSLKHGGSTVLQVGAWQLPPLMIAAWFPIDGVGMYNLATRLLEAPLTLLGNSFSIVFFRKLSKSDPKTWLNYLSRTLKPLIFFPPILVLLSIFLGRDAFGIVFGKTWSEAGAIFAILSLLYWWRLVYTVCSPMYLLFSRLEMDLLFSAMLLTSQVSAVYLGYHFLESLNYSLILMSVSTSAIVIISVWWVYAECRLRAKV